MSTKTVKGPWWAAVPEQQIAYGVAVVQQDGAEDTIVYAYATQTEAPDFLEDLQGRFEKKLGEVLVRGRS